jgi:hypothetical protein
LGPSPNEIDFQIQFHLAGLLSRVEGRFNLGGGFRHASCRLDVGAVQANSLSVDPAASLAAYAEIAGGAPPLAQAPPAGILSEMIGDRRGR